jgi:fluoroacetyl-CoA thioesterase
MSCASVSGLAPGLSATSRYRVTADHTVPALFEDAPLLAVMPPVLATAYLVALMERACIECMAPFYGEGQVSLGIAMDMTHDAPNVIGDELVITVTCTAIEKRQSTWAIEARTGDVVVGRATHRRALVAMSRFVAGLPAPRPGSGS